MYFQILTIWIFLMSLVAAVYDNEAFKTDWLLPQLGKVQKSKLTKSGKNFVTISESGVLSLLDLSNKGDLVWRQKIDIQGASDNCLVETMEDDVVVVSCASKRTNSGFVQFWNQSSSFLIQQVPYEGEIVAVAVTDSHVVFVDSAGSVSVAENFKSISPVAKVLPSEYIATSLLSNGNLLIITEGSASLFDANTLEIVSTQKIPTPVGSKWSKLLGNKYIFETKSSRLNVLEFTDYAKDLSNFKTIKTDYTVDQAPFVDWNSLIRTDNKDFYATSKNLQNSISVTVNEHVVIAYTETHSHVLDSEFGIEHAMYETHIDDLTNIKELNVRYIEEKAHKLVTVVQYNDDKFVAFENGVKVWEFDNSLSSISKVAVYSKASKLEHELKISTSFKERLQSHWKQLIDLDKHLNQVSWKEWILSSSDKSSEFGLEKLLITLSETQKVTALDMNNGTIMWSFAPEKLSKLKAGNVVELVVDSEAEKVLIWFDSGKLLQLKADDGQFLGIQAVVEHEIDTVILADQPNDWIIGFKGSFERVSTLKDVQQSSEIFFVDSSSSQVCGYKAESTVTQTWCHKVTEPNTIIATAYNKPNEGDLAPIGTVLGDRSVLYKYLYPNLGAFVSQNVIDNSFEITIYDTITGGVIRKITHPASEKINFNVSKFQLVFKDNYLVYSYYSLMPTISTKLVVVELYESQFSNKKTLSLTQNFSALHDSLPMPFIKTKAYNYPYAIDKLIISNTKYGITTKNLILKLSNGRIALLPKFIVSARRVEGRDLTNDEKSEFMMIPYDSLIPIDNNQIVTHKRIIISNKNTPDQLISAATELESTSFVCYANNDIFCTKIYPSLQFDVLSSSFSKGKLLLTILSLFVAFIYTHSAVNSKKLNSFWIDSF